MTVVGLVNPELEHDLPRWNHLRCVLARRSARRDAKSDAEASVEQLIGSPAGTKVAAELPARGAWLVPTIVQLELAKWLTREAGEDKADQVIAFTETCVVADLDTATALSAADLSARHKLATADAIVYATALAHGSDLLTCDRHLEGLPDVRLVPKADR